MSNILGLWVFGSSLACAEQGVSRILFLTIVMLLVSSDIAHALVIREYDADRHRRFTFNRPEEAPNSLIYATSINHNPNFFAAEYNWSGYGWGLENPNRGALLVSSRHYITSKHAYTQDISGLDVAFTNADGEIFKYEIERIAIMVDDGVPLGGDNSDGNDVVVVTLTEDVDSSLTPFRLVDDPYWILNREVIIAGGQGGGGRLAGREVVEHYKPATTGDPLTDVDAERYRVFYNSTTQVGGDEAHGQGGDSGNPWFTVFNGELVLAGAWFTSSSAASYGGSIADLIQAEVWQDLPSYNIKYAHPEADFTSDDFIDAEDIDAIFAAVSAALLGQTDLVYDLTGDGVVDKDDVDYLVLAIIGTVYGDVNLDGRVSLGDHVILSEHNHEEGGWAIGNMNGDLYVGIGDWVILVENYGYNGGLNPIPTPATLVAMLSLLSLYQGNRRRKFVR